MAPGRGVWRERRRARDSERDIASSDRQEDRCRHRPCLDRSGCQLRDGVRSSSTVRPLPRRLSLRWFLELFASSIRMRLRADVHCRMPVRVQPSILSRAPVFGGKPLLPAGFLLHALSLRGASLRFHLLMESPGRGDLPRREAVVELATNE